MSQLVKNWPAKKETRVQSLGHEDSLEKEMATECSCLENSVDRGAGRLQPVESQRVRKDCETRFHFYFPNLDLVQLCQKNSENH